MRPASCPSRSAAASSAARRTSALRGGVGARRASVQPRGGWREDSPLDDGRAAERRKKKKRNGKRQHRGDQPSGKGSAEGATLKHVDLGKGKSVSLYTPNDVADVAVGETLSGRRLASLRDELYGSGDVVWPAAMALARLVAHCPSLVQGKRVLEVGAGLGLVGNAAAQAGAAEVVMVDVDAEVVG